MISVLPGQSFQFQNQNVRLEIEHIVEEVSRLIRGASPFVESIEFLNKTKACSVDITFENQKMTIIFRNPADEVFDLNEFDNPVSPVRMTGR